MHVTIPRVVKSLNGVSTLGVTKSGHRKHIPASYDADQAKCGYEIIRCDTDNDLSICKVCLMLAIGNDIQGDDIFA
jgi:hypothetical protein